MFGRKNIIETIVTGSENLKERLIQTIVTRSENLKEGLIRSSLEIKEGISNTKAEETYIVLEGRGVKSGFQ